MKGSLLALLLAGAAVSSQAVTTGVLSPTAAGGAAARSAIKPDAAKTMADDTSGLRTGTIEAVDIARGSFRVFGQALNLDVAKVRVFGRDGKPTTAYALQRGTKVRFTLDPADPTHRRVAVVYLD